MVVNVAQMGLSQILVPKHDKRAHFVLRKVLSSLTLIDGGTWDAKLCKRSGKLPSMWSVSICLVMCFKQIYIYHGPPKPTFLEVFMVNNLVFRWPKRFIYFYFIFIFHGFWGSWYIYIYCMYIYINMDCVDCSWGWYCRKSPQPEIHPFIPSACPMIVPVPLKSRQTPQGSRRDQDLIQYIYIYVHMYIYIFCLIMGYLSEIDEDSFVLIEWHEESQCFSFL